MKLLSKLLILKNFKNNGEMMLLIFIKIRCNLWILLDKMGGLSLLPNFMGLLFRMIVAILLCNFYKDFP
jgi:hypothetical protein